MPGLKHQPQVQVPRGRLRAGRLHEDVRSVASAQVIPCVGGEDLGFGIHGTPVGANVEDAPYNNMKLRLVVKLVRIVALRTRQSWTGEVTSDYGNCPSDTPRSVFVHQ